MIAYMLGNITHPLNQPEREKNDSIQTLSYCWPNHSFNMSNKILFFQASYY